MIVQTAPFSRPPSGPQKFPLSGFGGGLNLRDQPDVVDGRQALDCLNVTFTERGGVASRGGYEAFTEQTGTARYDSLGAYFSSAGARHVVAGAGSQLDAINASGALVASVATGASPHYFARFGGPTAELLFCANGTDQLRQYNGSAFSTPGWTGTAPTGTFVAVSSWGDNRLMNARRSGSTAGDNPSTVRFANVGVPTTWTANDYVDLRPGDGEAITAMVAWQDGVYVFKESAIFRFYGADTDEGGDTQFSYSTLDTGIGCSAPGAVCAARDGVYFFNNRGIYRVRGAAAPELVSELLDPLFYGPEPHFYQGGVLNDAQKAKVRLTAHREQVYVALPTGSSSVNDRVLYFDPRYEWWSLWDLPAAALLAFPVGDEPELLFAYATGANHIGRQGEDFTTDGGVTITSRWQGGWTDFGADVKKLVRLAQVWGRGKVSLALAPDFDVESATAGTVDVDFTQGLDVWTEDASDVWTDDATDVWAGGRVIAAQQVAIQAHGTKLSVAVSNYDATPWELTGASLYALATGRTSGDE
jgi:hypothetical protein